MARPETVATGPTMAGRTMRPDNSPRRSQDDSPEIAYRDHLATVGKEYRDSPVARLFKYGYTKIHFKFINPRRIVLLVCQF